MLLDDLDEIDDVRIEFREFLRRDPVLLEGAPADVVDLVPIEEATPDLEARDVPDVPRGGDPCVPLLGDSGRVLLGQHGVEDGLRRKARWEGRSRCAF